MTEVPGAATQFVEVAPSLSAPRANAFPRVDLTPPQIANEARVRSAKLMTGGAAVVAAGLVVGLYVLASGDLSSAKTDLDNAKTSQQQLAVQVQQLNYIPQTIAAADLAKSQLAQAMSGEVRWSFVLNDLALTTPKDIGLKSMAASLTSATNSSPGQASNGTASVLGGTGIAKIDFAGEGRTYASVGAWLESIARQKNFLDPWATTLAGQQSEGSAVATGAPTLITFDATTTVTAKALSHRFDGTAGR